MEYFMILDTPEYNELLDIAQENNDFLLKTTLKQLEWDKEMNRWIAEFNRSVYCMVICELRQLRHKSGLIPRLEKFGKDQDSEFEMILLTVDKEFQKNLSGTQ